MDMRVACVVLLLLGLGGPMLACAASPSETAFLALWKIHAATNNDPATVRAACRQYLEGHRDDPYAPVVLSIDAGQALCARQTGDAAAIFTNLLTGGTGPVADAARTMAERGLTRLDRERVKAALTAYYAVHVVFPETLAALSADNRNPPPATDRWGKPWRYRLAAYMELRGLQGQRYVLESPALGATSDLAGYLKQPFVSAANVKALRVLPAAAGHAIIEFAFGEPKPGKVILAEGASYNGINFVRQASSFVLLSDGDRWLVADLPGAGAP